VADYLSLVAEIGTTPRGNGAIGLILGIAAIGGIPGGPGEIGATGAHGLRGCISNLEINIGSPKLSISGLTLRD
jgi:hypothetical protein